LATNYYYTLTPTRETYNMKTLSRTARLYDRSGYLQKSGVTVIEHPETDKLAAIISVNGAEHRRDDLEVAADRIRHKSAGWEVVL
jgi:predicted nuclease with RNAse H fold